MNDSKISKLKRNWDQGMEKLLKLIDEDETFNSNAAAAASGKLLGEMFYVLLIRGDIAKHTFNLHKGVIYNPPYIDGSAGGDEPYNEEGFVDNVEDNDDKHKFSYILLVLIIVVLFLHLFTDFKII